MSVLFLPVLFGIFPIHIPFKAFAFEVFFAEIVGIVFLLLFVTAGIFLFLGFYSVGRRRYRAEAAIAVTIEILIIVLRTIVFAVAVFILETVIGTILTVSVLETVIGTLTVTILEAVIGTLSVTVLTTVIGTALTAVAIIITAAVLTLTAVTVVITLTAVTLTIAVGIAVAAAVIVSVAVLFGEYALLAGLIRFSKYALLTRLVALGEYALLTRLIALGEHTLLTGLFRSGCYRFFNGNFVFLRFRRFFNLLCGGGRDRCFLHTVFYGRLLLRFCFFGSSRMFFRRGFGRFLFCRMLRVFLFKDQFGAHDIAEHLNMLILHGTHVIFYFGAHFAETPDNILALHIQFFCQFVYSYFTHS